MGWETVITCTRDEWQRPFWLSVCLLCQVRSWYTLLAKKKKKKKLSCWVTVAFVPILLWAILRSFFSQHRCCLRGKVSASYHRYSLSSVPQNAMCVLCLQTLRHKAGEMAPWLNALAALTDVTRGAHIQLDLQLQGIRYTILGSAGLACMCAQMYTQAKPSCTENKIVKRQKRKETLA